MALACDADPMSGSELASGRALMWRSRRLVEDVWVAMTSVREGGTCESLAQGLLSQQ